MKLVGVICYKNYLVFYLIKNIVDMYMYFIFVIRMTKIKRLKYCNYFIFNG